MFKLNHMKFNHSSLVSYVSVLLLFIMFLSNSWSAEKVELDGMKVRGNTELPKVLYIIPWKQAPVGELVGRPVESLLDEALSSIDRDIFLREVSYYESLKEYDRKVLPATGGN